MSASTVVRQPAGVPVGGQFAVGAHSEPDGLTLAPDDVGVVGRQGQTVRLAVRTDGELAADGYTSRLTNDRGCAHALWMCGTTSRAQGNEGRQVTATDRKRCATDGRCRTSAGHDRTTDPGRARTAAVHRRGRRLHRD